MYSSSYSCITICECRFYKKLSENNFILRHFACKFINFLDTRSPRTETCAIYWNCFYWPIYYWKLSVFSPLKENLRDISFDHHYFLQNDREETFSLLELRHLSARLSSSSRYSIAVSKNYHSWLSRFIVETEGHTIHSKEKFLMTLKEERTHWFGRKGYYNLKGKFLRTSWFTYWWEM